MEAAAKSPRLMKTVTKNVTTQHNGSSHRLDPTWPDKNCHRLSARITTASASQLGSRRTCASRECPHCGGSDENCHLVRARAIRLPECVVARRKCHAKKLAVGCQRCCNWLCYRHGDALAHQLVGTLHRSAGADHLDDEKCRAEILDIIFLRWDVAKRQKLSCDGVVGPSFASMK